MKWAWPFASQTVGLRLSEIVTVYFLETVNNTSFHSSLFLCSTFNWTVPFLSWLAITALCLATLLLYLIPLRYLVLAWGEAWLLLVWFRPISHGRFILSSWAVSLTHSLDHEAVVWVLASAVALLLVCTAGRCE